MLLILNVLLILSTAKYFAKYLFLRSCQFLLFNDFIFGKIEIRSLCELTLTKKEPAGNFARSNATSFIFHSIID